MEETRAGGDLRNIVETYFWHWLGLGLAQEPEGVLALGQGSLR